MLELIVSFVRQNKGSKDDILKKRKRKKTTTGLPNLAFGIEDTISK